MHVHPIFLKFNFLMVSPKYSTNCNFKLSLHIHLSWTCIPILVQALRKHHKELRTGSITFIVVRKSLYNQEAHFSEVGRVSNSYIQPCIFPLVNCRVQCISTLIHNNFIIDFIIAVILFVLFFDTIIHVE